MLVPLIPVSSLIGRLEMSTPQRPLYFDTIDVLRGFAALSVVIYHLIEHLKWQAFPVSGPLVWFRLGWMGVDLFFVISGFVIGLSAFAEIDKSGVNNFRKPFMRRRLARIVPLHYLTMLVFVVFVAPELLFTHFWLNCLAHLTFLHNLDIRLHGAINGSNWSLGTEMQFYVLMLIIAPWVRQTRLLSIFVVLVATAWAWRYGVTVLVSPTAEFGSFPVFVAATQLPGMLDEFAAGLLIARLVRMPSVRHQLGRLIVRLAIAVAAGIFTTITMIVYWRHASYWDNAWMVTSWRSLLALSFALILLTIISIPVSGFIRRMLAPFFYLGTISYGIYLWHLPVLLALKRMDWLSPAPLASLCVILTCLFASISWHFFEKPLIERFRAKAVDVSARPVSRNAMEPSSG
jgi:peptidoglycan/LPS O-acetylase OafA/YrhL